MTRFIFALASLTIVAFVVWEELQSRHAIDQFWEDWARPPR